MSYQMLKDCKVAPNMQGGGKSQKLISERFFPSVSFPQGTPHTLWFLFFLSSV